VEIIWDLHLPGGDNLGSPSFCLGTLQFLVEITWDLHRDIGIPVWNLEMTALESRMGVHQILGKELQWTCPAPWPSLDPLHNLLLAGMLT